MLKCSNAAVKMTINRLWRANAVNMKLTLDHADARRSSIGAELQRGIVNSPQSASGSRRAFLAAMPASVSL
jgi:hypothetical protein